MRHRPGRRLALICAMAALVAPTYVAGGLPAAATSIVPTTTTSTTITAGAATQPAPPPTPAPIRRQSPAWKVTPPQGADCPTGSTKLTPALVSEGFEGFDGSGQHPWVIGPVSIVAEDDGNHHAQTVGEAGVPELWELQTPALAPKVARLYVRFDVKGDFAGKDLVVADAQGQGWYVVPAADAQPPASATTWRTVRMDFTDAANSAAGRTDLVLRWARLGGKSGVADVDNIEVYQCTPTPSREPGDLNGDGLADAKFVMPSGDLLFVAGAPYPIVPSSVWRGGVGFDRFTWITAAGDVTGDGLSDLLTRAGNGDLIVYAGDGVRTFPTARKVGNGWQWMRWILPVGDVDGNGRQDLIAGSTDGYMRFYSFRADGLLEGGRIVGNGWNIFTHVVAIRSEPALATPTRLYGITRSGDMLSYTVTATGNMYGTGTKVGNGWFFPKVASAGDMDGDGLDDVVAVASDGHAYVYPTLGQGRWKGRITLPGTTWNQAKLVG